MCVRSENMKFDFFSLCFGAFILPPIAFYLIRIKILKEIVHILTLNVLLIPPPPNLSLYFIIYNNIASWLLVTYLKTQERCTLSLNTLIQRMEV